MLSVQSKEKEVVAGVALGCAFKPGSIANKNYIFEGEVVEKSVAVLMHRSFRP